MTGYKIPICETTSDEDIHTFCFSQQLLCFTLLKEDFSYSEEQRLRLVEVVSPYDYLIAIHLFHYDYNRIFDRRVDPSTTIPTDYKSFCKRFLPHKLECDIEGTPSQEEDSLSPAVIVINSSDVCELVSFETTATEVEPSKKRRKRQRTSKAKKLLRSLCSNEQIIMDENLKSVETEGSSEKRPSKIQRRRSLSEESKDNDFVFQALKSKLIVSRTYRDSVRLMDYSYRKFDVPIDKNTEFKYLYEKSDIALQHFMFSGESFDEVICIPIISEYERFILMDLGYSDASESFTWTGIHKKIFTVNPKLLQFGKRTCVLRPSIELMKKLPPSERNKFLKFTNRCESLCHSVTIEECDENFFDIESRVQVLSRIACKMKG